MKKILLIIVLIISTLIVGLYIVENKQEEVEAAGSSWYDEAWNYRKKITIPAFDVAENLTDFPVYVDLTDLGIDFFSKVKTDGTDIIVTSSNGTTKLSRELVEIDSVNRTGELWFKAPSLSSTVNNEFYIYYGNSGGTETNTADVWSNGFIGVWHMNEDPSISTDGECGGGVFEICDSTSYSHDGDMAGSMTNNDLVSGKLGSAIDFDGSNDTFNIYSSSLNTQFNGNEGTLSVWSKVRDSSIWTDGTHKYMVYLGQTNIAPAYNIMFRKTTTNNTLTHHRIANGVSKLFNYTFSSADWFQTTLTWSTAGDSQKSYVNGDHITTYTGLASWSPTSLNSSYTRISSYDGSYGVWDGQIDEVRISNTPRSAGWIETEYNNQSDTYSFIRVGSEESLEGVSWYNTAWAYRLKITIDPDKVFDNVTYFPVYVNLADLGQDFFSKIKSDGSDILVTSSNGTYKLYREIVGLTSSSGELWFRAEYVSDTDPTEFYIYFGNSSANETNSATTFSNGFVMVQHLNESPTNSAPQFKDSETNNQYNGTAVGSMTAGDLVDGKIGKAIDFDGTDDQITLGSNTLQYSNNFTASVWVKLREVNNGGVQHIFGTFGRRWAIQEESGNLQGMFFDTTNNRVSYAASLGKWYHVAMVKKNSGNGLELFINGESVGSNAILNNVVYASGNTSIGTDSYLYPARNTNGIIDEARFSSSVRSSGWIKTEYYNQSDPSTFFSINPIESQASQDWYNSNWKYRVKINIPSSVISSNLTNFPVFVNLSDLDPHLLDNANFDGSDIVVTNSNGTEKLSREIVDISLTNKTGELWFKAPNLSSTSNNEFYIYYGNPAGSETNDTEVWNNGYAMVLHMSNDPTPNGGDEMTDSSGNGNDGNSASALTSANVVDGILGGAIDFQANENHYFTVLNDPTLYPENFTISAWAKSDTSNWNVHGWVLNKNGNGSNGYMLHPNQGQSNFNFTIRDGAAWDIVTKPAHTITDWNFYSATFDGSTFKGYHNGQYVGETSVASPTYNVSDLSIGRDLCCAGRYGDGQVDEVRVSNVARSADWLMAEYNNQSSPTTFYAPQPYEMYEEKNWYDDAWKFRKKITISGSQIAGNVEDFPVYVDLADLGTHLFTFAQPDGEDIIVVSEDNLIKQDRELVSINSGSQTGELWFRANTLNQNESKSYYIYYGNASATETNTTSVWQNGFEFVEHMNEDPSGSAPQFINSVSGGLNGTSSGSLTSTDLVAGKIGTALDLTNNDIINYGSYTTNDIEYTIGVWLKNNNNGTVIGRGTSDSCFYNPFIGPTFVRESHCGGTNDITFSLDSNWHYVVTTRQNNISSVFVDGSFVESKSVLLTNPTTTFGRFFIGASWLESENRPGGYYSGLVDHTRISSVVRADSWIETEYNNQVDTLSFYSISSEEINSQFSVDTEFFTTSTPTDVYITFDTTSDITADTLMDFNYQTDFTIGGTGTLTTGDMSMVCDADGIIGGTSTNMNAITINSQGNGWFVIDTNTDTCANFIILTIDGASGQQFSTPPTEGNYQWSLDLDLSGDGSTDYRFSTLVFVSDSHRVYVSANIDSTLEFQLFEKDSDERFDGICDFGAMTITSVSTCSYDIGISNSELTGAVLTVTADGPFSTSGGDTVAYCGNSACSVDGNAGVTAGAGEYGYQISNLPAIYGAYGGYATGFEPLPVVETPIAFTNGDSTSANIGQSANRLEITHSVGISEGNQAGFYSHQLTYSVFAR